MVFEEESSWNVLGVAPGATSAEIRRAYARRLREIRPDEDAEGFQILIEARDQALQFAPDAAKSARPARALGWNTSEFVATDGPQAERPAVFQPRSAPARTEDPLAYPLAETARESQFLDSLECTLASARLEGWQTIVMAAGQLSQAQRAALELRIIEGLSSYAAREDHNLASWPPDKWGFFSLVAALEAEYGWRGNDRMIHAVLDEQAAEDFIRLLKWSQRSAPARPTTRTDLDSPSPMPVLLGDLHQFYDRGRDRRGLDAYWRMVNDASLWRSHDAATDLFLPVWNIQDGRFGRALLGLAGWTALILSFAPWRFASPWIGTRFDGKLEFASGMLVMIVALWTIIGSTPPHSPHRKARLVGPLWDGLAFLAFPIWAMARGLYLRALVGFIAWTALIYQVAHLENGLGLLGAVMLVVMLHVTAGEYGQRWVVYKLQRTLSRADGRRLFHPAKRAEFLWQGRTRNPVPWLDRWLPRARQPERDRTHGRLPLRWRWMLAAGVIMAIVRVVGALWLR